MRFVAFVFLGLSVAGCGDGETTGQTVIKLSEAALRNKQIEDSRADIGRYSFHPAGAEMPAVIFDTATGCIETFEKLTSVENPKEIRWARRFADTTLPKITYIDGKPEAIDGTAPPHRCMTFEASKK
ncbi:hypothetical protein [Parasphingorhabdus sp.]|uniref:hypothetical protein n=1 Tax=Parasphingorhabdus sp. TaxID=2709688 RepID=UPI002B264FDF|nr:hypothetical protein [Parasphingorhabdus sp.]